MNEEQLMECISIITKIITEFSRFLRTTFLLLMTGLLFTSESFAIQKDSAVYSGDDLHYLGYVMLSGILQLG